jgi:two-component system, NarL family, nitrate/nitrite response regulator NarL
MNAISVVKIVLAADLPIFRHGLRRLLELQPGLTIVAETGDIAQAPALVCEHQADLLLLDFRGTGRMAIETLEWLAAARSPARTILLADHLDRDHVEEALAFGAGGVVLKDSEADVLFESIRAVMAGDRWIYTGRAVGSWASVRKHDAQRLQAKAFGLTRRELDILRLVVAGSTNKKIAKEFSISENTVKSHLTHLLNKLGASNRVELVMFATHHRLLEGV